MVNLCTIRFYRLVSLTDFMKGNDSGMWTGWEAAQREVKKKRFIIVIDATLFAK